MTVSTTAVSVSYAGDGSTTAFPITFQFGTSADLSVVLVNDSTGAETAQSLTTHYTVSQSANKTGTLTMLTAPASGYTLRIRRITALTQPDSLRNRGQYYPETVEQMFDRNTRQIQEVHEATGRALRFPFGSSADGELSTPVAGGVPMVNDDADGFVWALWGTNPEALASLAMGSGSALVGFKQSGTGAVARTAQDKQRETVSPEDFGAVGDGTDRPVSQWLTGGALDRGYADLAAIQADYPHVTALTESLDWAAWQAAIGHCASTGKVLRAFGHYAHNRGLEIDSPIAIDGGGVYMAGTGTTPAYIAGTRITATAAIAHIIHAKDPVAGSGLYGMRINGLLLDANNLVQKCLQADSLIRCEITNIEAMRATVVGFDFNDGNGTYFFANRIDGLHYNSTASAAAQNSDGFWFRDTNSAGNLGCVQNQVGRISSFTVNGNGVVVGGADNNDLGSITTNTSTGTGIGLIWKGPTGFVNLQPRNNFVRYMTGTVEDQTNARTNTILNMPSEGASLTLTGTQGETLFRAFNYVTGRWWSFPDYKMRDVLKFSVGDLSNITGTASTAASLWPSILLAKGAVQGVGIAVGMPYEWHSGAVKAITLRIAMDAAVAGNVRFRVRGMTPANGGAIATPTLDETFTVTPDANALRHSSHTLTFGVPLAITRGDLLLLRVDRVGTGDALDTHTGGCHILGGHVHYTSDGPSADGGGGGPWQARDPAI